MSVCLPHSSAFRTVLFSLTCLLHIYDFLDMMFVLAFELADSLHSGGNLSDFYFPSVLCSFTYFWVWFGFIAAFHSSLSYPFCIHEQLG